MIEIINFGIKKKVPFSGCLEEKGVAMIF